MILKLIIMISVIPISIIIIPLFNRKLGITLKLTLFDAIRFLILVSAMWIVACLITKILLG